MPMPTGMIEWPLMFKHILSLQSNLQNHIVPYLKTSGTTGSRLLQFVRDCQKANGSWLYEPLNKKSFIDGFHTCFALKCLKAINDKRLSAEIEPIITSGYNYLLTAFTNDDMLSRRFSKANKINPVAFDLYDQAELLQVLILLKISREPKKLLISVNSLSVERVIIIQKFISSE